MLTICLTDKKISRALVCSSIFWLMQSYFYGCFSLKRAAAKIANSEQKQRRMDIAQKKLTTCNDDPD